MNLENLPKGWVETKLAHVAEWSSGGTPSRKEPAYYNGNVPWIKTGDLGSKVINSSSEYISELGVKNSSAKFMPKGSVAIAMYGATIGKTSILGIDTTTNQACGVGNPIEGITFSEFLYYFLLNEKDSFIAKGKGGAQPNISQALIKGHEIALPPLAEQKVIADKLDTLLAQVETTKARLERIPKILKTFRQSVLAAAVSGKLTEEWLGEKRSVGEVCMTGFDGPFGSKLKSADYTEFGVRVVRLENINHLHFDDTKRTYISSEKYLTLTKNTLKTDDILFSSFVDEEVRVCVFKSTNETFINKADCFCLRPNKSFIISEYLAYVLASITSYNQIKEQVQGVTRPRINLKTLKGLAFEFPALEQQTEIVRRVEQLFAFADSIEQKANAALERVNNLTQSILAKAFRGELTTQWREENPDLISGENSAEALLAKIRAERKALEKKPKPSPSKRRPKSSNSNLGKPVHG